MRKIRARNSRTKKALGEVGVPAPVSEDNFVTLTEPAFKPRLELIEGENHEQPSFSNSDIPEGLSFGEDPTRPTSDSIANGLSDDPIGDAKADKPPHEDEKVTQDNNNLDEEQLDLKKKSSSNEDFKVRFKMASRLSELKVANGLLGESQKDSYTDYLADTFSADQIDSYLKENQAWADSIQKKANKTAANESKGISRSPVVPTTSGSAVPGLKLANDSNIDPLEVICS